jgi:hypothetical protein
MKFLYILTKANGHLACKSAEVWQINRMARSLSNSFCFHINIHHVSDITGVSSYFPNVCTKARKFFCIVYVSAFQMIILTNSVNILCQSFESFIVYFGIGNVFLFMTQIFYRLASWGGSKQKKRRPTYFTVNHVQKIFYRSFNISVKV